MVTIRLEALGARYGKSLRLRDVTTPAFEGGAIVAVIGPNAAGKSTLFRRIAGLLAGPGNVHVWNARRERNAICYMPQDTSANAVLTVYESVLLARKQGMGWSVGDDDLSRQVEVLGLMRELAQARRMIVLIALHDLNHALRFSDQAMVIADGRLVACGSSPDITTSDLWRDGYHVNARIEPCSRGIGHVIVDGVADGRRTDFMSAAETQSGVRSRFEAAAVSAA
ncbi:MAG: ABC transporter ATP-binding protein [Mesorhizobium sp.]|uniref:ATP-binding cassette domain-containing protein n=1 Tax=Mesorhizobium sp. TaxID=1871066 RepID=UPI000FEAADB1|nr:ABC transporter ATP-binding protein [Mesorhizobium sp.]RWI08777.1 MAG: ABC transporter ATP-binding protein [Mesorhizobium sp.]RWM85780.1 MAG: ABC transporter ATP-binding protein [Mesorhizobium sp.]TIO17508.1 MAG: ABC transporter ATP-binding protein [Mesorhizobium sp.]TIP90370.1 MAG: ABC transporter ATP-binding protein [Mesorhizobium sp.]